MDSHMFDGMISGLVVMGVAIGLVAGAVAFIALPWVWSHFSIVMH